MKTNIRQTENLYECAYSNKYQGFEFIYIKTFNGKKILLFENRLAIEGIWLNDFQVVKMVKQYIDVFFKENQEKMIKQGSEIIIESYKKRGNSFYKADGMLSEQTPDYHRSIKILKLKKKLTSYQELQITQIINKVSKFHFLTTKIKPIKNRKLRKHFGFDDLGFAEFVMEIERLFNITLPDDKLNHVKTLNDFLKLVEKQL